MIFIFYSLIGDRDIYSISGPQSILKLEQQGLIVRADTLITLHLHIVYIVDAWITAASTTVIRVDFARLSLVKPVNQILDVALGALFTFPLDSLLYFLLLFSLFAFAFGIGLLLMLFDFFHIVSILLCIASGSESQGIGVLHEVLVELGLVHLLVLLIVL